MPVNDPRHIRHFQALKQAVVISKQVACCRMNGQTSLQATPSIPERGPDLCHTRAMTHGTIMIQGTTSDAGKSMLVTGICRLLVREGFAVAPFKPQNMALNSAVTASGGEIGRAQAVQARAARIAPHTDMNPVLIKPSSDTDAQIIVHGQAVGNMDAAHFHQYKRIARQATLDAYTNLQRNHPIVIVEGAGSPAEINLRENDIANMGFAEAVDCPVWLVADIDRGGVFAHLVGTLSLLSEGERERVRGFVINRFRGDLSLLQSGIDWLQQETGIPVVGVLPYLHGLYLESEDTLPRETNNIKQPLVHICVPALPRISNHTDMDPLRLHPQVQLQYVGPGEELPAADLVILPGSKNVRADLAWLRQQGWEQAINRHLRYGGKVLGICGGFQMLGQYIHDPNGLEGEPGSCPGLGWLDIETTLHPNKQLRQISGQLLPDGAPVRGYEIHQGVSMGPALNRPLLELENDQDGARSDDDQVLGTYVHGLLDTPEACSTILHWAGANEIESVDYSALIENNINRLADMLAAHLDLSQLYCLLKEPAREAS